MKPGPGQRPAERTFRDRWFLLAGSLVLLGLAGAGLWTWRKAQASRPPPAPLAPAEALLPAGAEVSYAGVVQARNVVAVAAPIDGILEHLEVEPGREVFEGQLLGRIRNEGLETAQAEAQQEVERIQTRVNNLESALIAARLEASRTAAERERLRVEYDKAEKMAARQAMLYREGATPRLTHEKAQKDFGEIRIEYDAARELAKQADERVAATTRDLDAAKRALEEKQTDLEGARADLQAAEVHAPVDGLLVGIRVNVGEEVDPAVKDLFQIAVDPSRLQIVIEPDPKIQPRLQDGLPVLVRILEFSADALAGELKVGEDGVYRVEFTAGDPAVKPGLNAIVKIKLP